MLFLFDIDGTLIDTGGAGMAALRRAAMVTFGLESPPLDLAGSTDLGIVTEMFEHFGREMAPAAVAEFFDVYHGLLAEHLASSEFAGRRLDGVVELLDAMAGEDGWEIGLLTGNTMQGAAQKMQHYGLSQYFKFGAYGSDEADRNALGPIALLRAQAHTGREFLPSETWVIGDTPKDIACAKAFGARCLAVATGMFGKDELSALGAERTVANLREVDAADFR